MKSRHAISSASEAVELPFYFSCARCGKKLKFRQFSGDRRFRCPECRHVFRVSQERKNPPTPKAALPKNVEEAGRRSSATRRRVPWLSVLFAALAFCGGLLLGQDGLLGRSAAPARGFDESGWQEYDYPKNRLKIALPRRPTIEEESHRPNGAAFAVRADLPTSDLEFCLHLFPATQPATEKPPSIDEIEKGVLADYPGSKTLSTRSFQWENCRAVEFHLKTPTGAAVRRIVFARERTCVLSVAGSDLVRHDQSIKHFLNSLQLEEFEAEIAPPAIVPEIVGGPRKAKR